MKKILLKAETHQGTIELPMTEKKALSFAKKLFENHKKEMAIHKGGHFGKYRYRYGSRWIPSRRPLPDGPQPFIKVEFKEIEE